MRFSAFSLLALPLAVLATPTPVNEVNDLVKRVDKASTVMSDLNTVLANVKKLTSDVNAIPASGTPSATQLTLVVTDANTLAKNLNQTIKDTKSSDAFTASESTALYNQINNNLLPATKTLLTAFKSRVTYVFRCYSCALPRLRN